MSELSVIVDEEDNFVKFALRSEMRLKNLLHRSVMVFVFFGGVS